MKPDKKQRTFALWYNGSLVVVQYAKYEFKFI